MKSISTCLWFNNQAEQAANFYIQLFGGCVSRVARYSESSSGPTRQTVGSVMTVDFEIANAKVMGLNGGPLFKFSPSFSFFVSCDSPEEITSLWSKLSADGTTRMALNKYPWAEMYGWTSDKFGVEWQLILAPNTAEKIVPSFLFTDSLYGKGQEAIDFYMSILPNSKIESNVKDPNAGTIMHCVFSLNGQRFTLMEGAGKHGHSFNESMSLVVNCDSQVEIDTYWDSLTADGGKPVQCGWLKDKFGVSWQIVPSNIEKYANDSIKFEKAMAAIMKMVKLDMAAIDRAANN